MSEASEPFGRLAMGLAKYIKLTHSIRLARLVRSCFIKNAPRFARGSNNTIYGDRNILLPLPGNVDVEEKYVDKKIIKKEKGKKKG